MDKYDKHLQFLIQVFPDKGIELCTDTFLNKAKRDVRKALFFLLSPDTEVEQLLLLFELSKEKERRIELLHQVFHSYCPNSSYTKIVRNLSKGIPFKIDTATLPKLKAYRNVPRKEVLQKLFRLVAHDSPEVVCTLLKGLSPFGREIEPFWAQVDTYANHPNYEIGKNALSLLTKMPTGVQKSILTFSNACLDPKMRFHSLAAMQKANNLPPKLLISIFNPIIAEYRRLAMSQGAKNDLWEEFRLIQSIARNNGLHLSIPNIDLGRF